jgi:hypothetical protein
MNYSDAQRAVETCGSKGEKGVARGTIGWPDYPKGSPSALEYCHAFIGPKIGSEVANADQAQAISSIRICPGASNDFTLYDDDGKTYVYEKEKYAGKITLLHWDEPAHQFTHGGTRAWTAPDMAVIHVIGR